MFLMGYVAGSLRWWGAVVGLLTSAAAMVQTLVPGAGAAAVALWQVRPSP